MKAKLAFAAVSIVVSLSGCGAEATRPASTTAMNEVRATEATTGSTAAPLTSNEAELAPAATVAVVDLTTLPPPPWSAPAMSASDAPRQLMSAWQNAENRDSCAPLATLSLGRASGARARTSELSGGWLVEFDRPGLPGIDRQGNECDSCGRSVVGIAGTSVAPDALLAPDSDSLAPSYSDGSHAEVEVTDGDGESVASVTFTVNGQGCVYEVWSLLGADHLAEIVAGLRFVEPSAVRSGVASADR